MCAIDKTTHSGLVDEARVQLLYASPFDNFAHVVLPHPAPGHDRDPVARMVHQLGDDIGSIQRRGFPTGCQDAMDANVDQLFERLQWINRRVECAVEGHRESTRRFNEGARFRHGDATFRCQRTCHDSIDAEVASGLDIFEDCLDFSHRVHEVTGARPNQHEELNSDSGGNF
jgi:hypothetical protein